MSDSEPTRANAAALPTPGQRPLRLWLRLAALLVLLGIPCYGIHRIHEDIRLVPEVEGGGGTVKLQSVGPDWFQQYVGDRYLWLFGTPTVLKVPESRSIDDRWIKRVHNFTRLEELSLANTGLSDRGMPSLARLERLSSLNLANTAISNTGLEQIRGFTGLHYLSLAGTQISDDGLGCLSGMTELIFLDLSHIRVSDQGLKCLAKMHRLKSLNLSGTQIDNAGLPEIVAHKSLEDLYLDSTNIDDSVLPLFQTCRLNLLRVGSTKITEAGLRKEAIYRFVHPFWLEESRAKVLVAK
jgi:hypothetical protein